MTVQRAAVLFAEDTGAANYLAPVPGLLNEIGVSSRFLAAAHATRQLSRLGVPHESVTPESSADDYLHSAPDLVVAGTGINLDSFGLGLISAARQARVETVGVVDQRQNLGDRFRGRSDDPLHHCPDWILVPDAVSQHYFAQQGVPETRVVVCGHPHFDRIYDIGRAADELERLRLRRRLFRDCPSGVPVLTFGTEPAIVVRGSVGLYQKTPDYTLHGRGGTPYRTHIVIEELLDALAELGRPVFKVLRLHPHEPGDGEFRDYYAEFDHVSDQGLPHEVLLASDLVVSISSMLLTEALLMGCPALSILPRRSERHMLLAVETGLIPSVCTRAELGATLGGLLANPTPADRASVADMFPAGSTARMRRVLADRLGQGSAPSQPMVHAIDQASD